MAEDVYDKIPLWLLDSFDKFRDDRYDFLFLCRGCQRAFDSKGHVENCKFCGDKVTEIRSVKRKKPFPLNRENRLYRYYCPLCEKNFLTSEKLTVCNSCKTDYMHVYTWDMLRKRDRLYIKLNKALKMVFRPQGRAIRENAKSSEEIAENSHLVHSPQKSLINF